MEAPLKIVHLVVAGDIGGAERLLVDLATRPALSGAEHSVALMTPNPKLREMFAAAGLRLRDRGPLRADPLSYLWRAFGPVDLAWLDRVLAEEAADLVHVHTYASHILGVRAGHRRGVPVLRTEHGVQHYADPSCALYRSWALRHTDHVVAVSDYVRNFVLARAPDMADRITTIHNGVDAARFHAAPPLGQGPFTVAVVCRLEPWKRIDLVIKAVARVPGVRLRIAGDGSALPRLRRLAERLGVADRVEFLGFLADPRPVFAGAHAAINASREEPCALSILETLATQRPVLAFAGGGNPELVQDGISGWLVRDGSLDAFAVRLAEAAASIDRAAELGRAARRQIERDGRIETMCAAYGAVYRQLAAKTKARG